MPHNFQFNFGRVATDRPAPRRLPEERFRIALLGDFSGRAHRGEHRIRDELARLKPLQLDVDTFSTIIEKFGTRLRLPMGAARDGGTIELNPTSLDDLHPDALYDSLALFSELARLRERLSQPGTFAAAAAEVRQWAPAPGAADASAPAPAPARNDAVRTDGGLIDFVALLGLPAMPPAPSPIDALIREVIRPHLQQAVVPDASDAPELTAAVDRALSASMREVLHHPDFQGLEAAWRSLDFIVRRVETDATLQVVVYDISADEFAADLGATDVLEDTGLYRLLVEQPALDPRQGALSALVGHYSFAMTAPHAELLGRIGAIAARAAAPFIAAIGHQGLQVPDDAMDPAVVQGWQALRKLPAAHYVALATPCFLLRQPYGKRSDEIERFAFEEFDPRRPPTHMLWGNPAVLAAVLLGQHVREAGADVAPARQLDVDNLPLCLWTDADGDAVAQPCTELLFTDRTMARVQTLGFIPVLQRQGRAEVRLGGFVSLAGAQLAGRWTSAG
jgi:predicted component of type VI protein secretion system